MTLEQRRTLISTPGSLVFLSLGLPLAGAALLFVAALPVSAADSKVRTETDGGLTQVLFDTTYGQIKCNLPADMASGDTISGTVFIEARGSGESTLKRNENGLNEYVIQVAGEDVPVRLGSFRLHLPAGTSSAQLALKNRKGTATGDTATVPVSPVAPSVVTADSCSLPQIGESNMPLLCRGRFDGDFRNTNIKLGSQELTKLAESPRSLVCQPPPNFMGAQHLSLTEGSREGKAPVNVTSVTVTLAETDLPRGKSSTVSIRVTGLPQTSETLELQIENANPGVVALEGGDVQTVGIKASSGDYQLTRKVDSLKSGRFLIRAKLKAGAQSRSMQMNDTGRPEVQLPD